MALIEDMADFVRRETESKMPVEAAVEGQDFVDPPPAPEPTPEPVPAPGPPPKPEILAVDLKGHRIHTTIGVFDLTDVESAKVAKVCLKPIKHHLTALYRTMSSISKPPVKRGRPKTVKLRKVRRKAKAKVAAT